MVKAAGWNPERQLKIHNIQSHSKTEKEMGRRDLKNDNKKRFETQQRMDQSDKNPRNMENIGK